MKILLIFTLCLISDGGASKKVTVYSGGGVLIKCKYDTEYRENQKYFCKGSWPGCSDQIKTGAKNEWINLGRFSLFDDTKSAEFSVMFRELTVEDTGTYQCGVDKDWIDIYTPVELKVKEGGSVSREVISYAGGGINIKCRYEDEYKDKPKSFYKMETHQWCFNRITTKRHSEWSHDGRFSTQDNRSAGFFSVFIRELITEDTGTYACAVVVSHKIQIYTVVKLKVRGRSYWKSISKTVHVGGDLNISCKYLKSLRSDPKFLCKTRLQRAACSYKESVKESRKYVNVGKFSLFTQNFYSIRSRCPSFNFQTHTSAIIIVIIITTTFVIIIITTSIIIITTSIIIITTSIIIIIVITIVIIITTSIIIIIITIVIIITTSIIIIVVITIITIISAYSSFSSSRISSFHCDHCVCNSAAASDWNHIPYFDSTKEIQYASMYSR
ncbi:hypothetical protein AMELA_G00186370 [Ameiurus melas]|uniref:Ig-like domain-containing protein n=1 Tax=Ameiurus melas TaxID=219545 RepID=A0A7J6AAF0_AMEME|nr:hypothetical protein AMELA_G00186370 [Ameiurus melas]